MTRILLQNIGSARKRSRGFPALARVSASLRSAFLTASADSGGRACPSLVILTWSFTSCTRKIESSASGKSLPVMSSSLLEIEPRITRSRRMVKLRKHLGRGGMADVWKAYDPQLDRNAIESKVQ